MRHVEGVLEGGVQGAIKVGAEHDASPAADRRSGEARTADRRASLPPRPRPRRIRPARPLDRHSPDDSASPPPPGWPADQERPHTGPIRRSASRGRRIRCIRPGESGRATRPGSDANSGPAGRGDAPSDRERPRAGSPSSSPRAAGGRARMTGRPDTSGDEERPPDSRVGHRSQWIGLAPWSPSPR